jgi:hypothetical protein
MGRYRWYHADLSTVLSGTVSDAFAEGRYRLLAAGTPTVSHSIALVVVEKPTPANMPLVVAGLAVEADRRVCEGAASSRTAADRIRFNARR